MRKLFFFGLSIQDKENKNDSSQIDDFHIGDSFKVKSLFYFEILHAFK